MHYLALVTTEIPASEIEQKTVLNPLHDVRHVFSREVSSSVTLSLERYAEDTQNPDYLEFWDQTKYLEAAHQGGIDCIKLPEGRIVPIYEEPFSDRFGIWDGKVYERYAGPLKHKKRTKRAKRIKALPDYPISHFYPTIASLAEDFYGYTYHKEQNAYGFYYNPDAFYDWYSIGGRWPHLFLVKDSCMECSSDEGSWKINREEVPAPEGYKWAYAARKKDIEWQVIKEWHLQKQKEHFKNLETLFMTGERAKDLSGSVTEDGILFCGKLIYKKGEDEESYLSRLGYDPSIRYPVFFYGYLNEDGLQTKESLISTDKDNHDFEKEWNQIVDHYLDSLAEDTVLVGIDYHL